MKKKIQSLLLISFVFFSAGCSKIDLGYKLADWYFEKEFYDLVELEVFQKKNIRRELKNWVKWHKKEMAPKISQYFKSNVEIIEKKKFDEESLRGSWLKIKDLFIQSMRPIIPPLSRTLVTLNKKQILNLKEEIKIRNKKIEISGRMNQKKKEKVFLKRAQDTGKKWVGPLRDIQKKYLRKYLEFLEFPYKERLAFRLGIQEEFFKEVQSKGRTALGIEKILTKGLVDREKHYSKTYQTKVQIFSKDLLKIISRLLHTLNDDQIAHFKKKNQTFASDFLEISK